MTTPRHCRNPDSVPRRESRILRRTLDDSGPLMSGVQIHSSLEGMFLAAADRACDDADKGPSVSVDGSQSFHDDLSLAEETHGSHRQ